VAANNHLNDNKAKLATFKISSKGMAQRRHWDENGELPGWLARLDLDLFEMLPRLSTSSTWLQTR
jgi:hypothetical protein